MDYITLYKLNKEIQKSRDTRRDVTDKFFKDTNNAIHDLNIDYLTHIPYPLIMVNRNIFENNLVKVKIYREDYKYQDYLFDSTGLVSNNQLEDEIINRIIPYINGLFRVREEESILDNEFYQDLIINLYNRYVDKAIINGYGVSLENINIKKSDFIKLYKEILKKVKIINSQELDKYRLNNSKKKVLEMYRG